MCDLDSLEADGSLHPEAARVRGAGMVEDLFVFILDDLRLSSSHPLHVDVAIALVVSRCDTQGDRVVFVWVQVMQVHHQGRKEASKK